MARQGAYFAFGAGLGIALLSALPAAAHHGWGWYSEQPGEVTGTVESANVMGGPHGSMRVRVGNELWDVVLAPPNRNATAGLRADSIKVGTQITARGHKWKEPGRLEIKTERLVVGKKTYDLYPNRP